MLFWGSSFFYPKPSVFFQIYDPRNSGQFIIT